MKTAFITGICGQDGSYLAKFLLNKGYCVIGSTRSIISKNDVGLRFLDISNALEIIEVNDFSVENLRQLIKRHKIDEVYNLAAQSSVGESFRKPIETIGENVMSVASWLEAIKLSNQPVSFYQASSSEMYGNVGAKDLPIREGLIFNPASPYGISKAAAHWICVNYREAHGLNIGCGILFNHESVLRGSNYIIKKVIHQAVQLREGLKSTPVKVGNLDIKRDWGYAPLYVQAMWRILQQPKLEDYHICSGSVISLREFVFSIFKELSLDPDQFLIVDHSLYRPVDLLEIYGDNTKAKSNLNWEYSMTTDELVKQLIRDEYQFIEWKARN
jgi:GDPmannose 4,6-dehydratase